MTPGARESLSYLGIGLLALALAAWFVSTLPLP